VSSCGIMSVARRLARAATAKFVDCVQICFCIGSKVVAINIDLSEQFEVNIEEVAKENVINKQRKTNECNFY